MPTIFEETHEKRLEILYAIERLGEAAKDAARLETDRERTTAMRNLVWEADTTAADGGFTNPDEVRNTLRMSIIIAFFQAWLEESGERRAQS